MKTQNQMIAFAAGILMLLSSPTQAQEDEHICVRNQTNSEMILTADEEAAFRSEQLGLVYRPKSETSIDQFFNLMQVNSAQLTAYEEL